MTFPGRRNRSSFSGRQPGDAEGMPPSIPMGCYRPEQPVVLASSGGADSLGALACLVRLRDEGLLGPLSVLSINHGLHPDGGGWSELALGQARHFGVVGRRIDVTVPETGNASLEARARQVRYAALADSLRREAVLVTAHHREDQAETFLLAALRGAGPTGLAAMPVWTRFARGWHWRPFLDRSRAELRAWAAETGLDWVDDPSNADTRFDRNYLRHDILPSLTARWPAAIDRLSVAAGLQAETLALLDTLAELDARDCGCMDCGAMGADDETGADDMLDLTALRRLTPARQTNLLRFWLRGKSLDLPSAAQLETLRQQVQDETSTEARLDWPGGSLRRYRQTLYLLPPSALNVSKATALPQTPWPSEQDVCFLSDGRVLRRLPALEEGAAHLDRQGSMGAWRLRARQPGDRIRPRAGGPSRDLKHWFQDRGIPPWAREQTVVLTIDGQLAALYVAGAWRVDSAFQAQSGKPAWSLVWQEEGGAAMLPSS